MFLSIQDFFVEMLSKGLYGLVQAFLRILYWLERVFKILAGVEAIPGSSGNSNTILDNLLGDSITAKLINLFLFIGLAMFIISLCVGLIRANLKKDSPGESKKVLSTSIKALFYFIFLPTLFVVFVKIIGQVLNITVNSVANSIVGTTGSNNITTANSSIANTLFTRMFDATDRSNLKLLGIDFTWSYDDITAAGISLAFDNTSFQYIILIVVSAIMFWTLGIATIGLAERLINVILLYLLGPVMIGASPMDSGQRLNIWKDKVIVKLFGAMGNILSMYIFLLLLGVVGDIVDKNSNVGGEDGWILTCIYAVVCIAGAMMCCKGSTLIASLISSNSGQEEGLSTMTTSQLAGQGLKLASAGIGAVTGGALAATKALANKGLGVNNKSISNPRSGAMSAATGGLSGTNNNSNISQLAASGGATPGSDGTGKSSPLQAAASKGGLIGLGAGAVGLALGAGKLLSSPISKGVSAIKDRMYQNKMNKSSDGTKLAKDDPNRMTFHEAKNARQMETAAKKQALANSKSPEQKAKEARQTSIQRQAQKRGESQAQRITRQENGAYRKNLAEKADKMLNNKKYANLSNDERRIAKKEIISSLGGSRSTQSLDQKIQAAIKKSKSSPLSQVGQTGGSQQ